MIKYENALRNSAAYRDIKRDVDNDALSHAYMLVSPDGEAVKELFKLVACAVYCDNDVCLECADCRGVLSGRNLDVNFINLLEKKITVDTVNELIESSFMAPRYGKRKLYFILSAEQMNAAAQNKLLKTLEEPPRSVSIFLGVKSTGAMLDTIKSRVRTVNLDLFSSEVIYDEMLKITGDEGLSRTAAACSQGMLGRAEQIALSKDYLAVFDKAFELLNKLQKSKDIAGLLSDKAFDKDNFPALLDALSVIFRDMLVSKTDLSLIESKHKQSEIVELAEGYSPLAIGKIVYLINEERKKLTYNVGGVAVAENLLFGLLEVKYKCR